MYYEQETHDLRYDLILQAANEKDRNLGDLRKNVFAWPVLMAKGSQILGRRKCAGSSMRSNHNMTICGSHLGISFFIVVKVFSKIRPLMSFAS